MPLPAFDFDLEGVDILDLRSSQSMMSIRERSGSISGSSQNTSLLGLNLPSSSGNSQYRIPHLDPFGNSPVAKVYETLGRDDEEEFLNNDDLFAFDEDGQLQEVQETEREQRLAGAVSVGHYPSDSAAEARVRKDHEGGLTRTHIDRDGDFNMAYGDDDLGILLDDVIPFGELPLMTGGLEGDDQPQRHSSQDRVLSIEESSSESAEARQVKRRPRAPKVLVADKQLELKSSEMKIWQNDYLDRMEKARKETKEEKNQFKKNAFTFVFGGLNGIGGGIGSSKIPSPLDMFAGESLLALITGKSVAEATIKKSKKRKADNDNSTLEPKRVRESEQGRNSTDFENAISNDEAGYMPMYDDDFSQSIEVGRDAASALQDHPSSALMPWNKSASLHSHNRNLSSQHGRSSQFGAAHNRLLSSPLIGRGSALLGDLDQFMPPDDEDMVMYGREDEDEGSSARHNQAAGTKSSSPGLEDKLASRPQTSGSQAAAEEFEMFGQAANVDTQTATSSQWLREALDQESNNFFEYVRNTIEENRDDELAADDEAMANSARNQKGDFVTFEGLFDVNTNSHIVAAQAFYHVLCLATKSRVWVEQDSEDGIEPFGEIRIGIAQAS
jgi:hypothetical protein